MARAGSRRRTLTLGRQGNSVPQRLYTNAKLLAVPGVYPDGRNPCSLKRLGIIWPITAVQELMEALGRVVTLSAFTGKLGVRARCRRSGRTLLAAYQRRRLEKPTSGISDTDYFATSGIS